MVPDALWSVVAPNLTGTTRRSLRPLSSWAFTLPAAASEAKSAKRGELACGTVTGRDKRPGAPAVNRRVDNPLCASGGTPWSTGNGSGPIPCHVAGQTFKSEHNGPNMTLLFNDELPKAPAFAQSVLNVLRWCGSAALPTASRWKRSTACACRRLSGSTGSCGA
jgi:hypothetical protein